MRGGGMYLCANVYLGRFGRRRPLTFHDWLLELMRGKRQRSRSQLTSPRRFQLRACAILSVALVLLTTGVSRIQAQQTASEALPQVNVAARLTSQGQQTPATTGKRSITLADAVQIFMQRNLQLVA